MSFLNRVGIGSTKSSSSNKPNQPGTTASPASSTMFLCSFLEGASLSPSVIAQAQLEVQISFGLFCKYVAG
ncbi:uncharacterized protein MELLADRAFT_55720 [Melampsora larici-populina 98AG31]|uniref:Uncharacterized protein n=1 Tax=Melampsora larici-populina (strain 98AG31 / pathotype 3-4-7) TaxID=747676 RepID=F4RHQ4_MELLP|nr:uncharacterized protein MELLADRAFT_55720 [Melampsora larici-populina 98AG31]EGG07865.1 hypothetical protein MELLADRAFT_55720 [Melampsora larici-populina 98AG31]